MSNRRDAIHGIRQVFPVGRHVIGGDRIGDFRHLLTTFEEVFEDSSAISDAAGAIQPVEGCLPLRLLDRASRRGYARTHGWGCRLGRPDLHLGLGRHHLVELHRLPDERSRRGVIREASLI